MLCRRECFVQCTPRRETRLRVAMDGAMRHERAASRRGFEFRRDFRARNTGGSPAATAGATERRYQPCGTLRVATARAGSNGKIPGGQNDQKAETARNRQRPSHNRASAEARRTLQTTAGAHAMRASAAEPPLPPIAPPKVPSMKIALSSMSANLLTKESMLLPFPLPMAFPKGWAMHSVCFEANFQISL